MSAPEYIFDAASKPSLPWHEVPLIRATEESVKGYGCLVDDPDGFEIEIVQWPQQGRRPIDAGTGDEAGWVEGTFECNWQGDNLRPEKVVAFWCDGSQGLYIHPGIWHEGIFPVEDQQRFLDRQGKVHARVSADIGQEFGVYLSCPLDPAKIKDL